jgi:gamma-glutamyltranspeptidase/glutathione hydrolase
VKPSSSRARAVAAATDGSVAEVATAVLRRGNAVDAVVAGVFAASGQIASVLLGPVQILVGGEGVGLHAIDGRVQQPGRGLARPRGFVSEDAVPLSARVGAPALPAALATVLASFGKTPLARVLSPAIDLARSVSKARAELLQRIAAAGPRALTRARVAGELVLAAGRGAGGLLSERDLEDLRPRVIEARVTRVGDGRLVTVPWGAEAVRSADAEVLPAEATHVVMAMDAHGQIAVACYEVANDGLLVEALELVAPAFAAPVRRGQTRVRPGEPRLAAAPIALQEWQGALDLGAGASGGAAAEKTLGDWLRSYEERRATLAPAPPPLGLFSVARVGRESKVVTGGPRGAP